MSSLSLNDMLNILFTGMKQSMCKIATMVLILLALSSCEVKEHNDFSEMNSQNDSSAEQQNELEVAMQQGPLDAYEALVSALQHSTRSESQAVLASLPSNLPEYFGGTYINDANQLVVQIVDQYYSDKQATTLRAVNGLEKVQYEVVKYSYKELEDAKMYIEKQWENSSFLKDNVTMYGINFETNSVLVGFDNLKPEIVAQFKNEISDSPIYTFENIGYVIEDALQGGDSLAVENAAISGIKCASLGYRAIDKQNAIGIVTAGHFINTSEHLRECKTKRYETIGLCRQSLDAGRNKAEIIDAAFCTIQDANYLPTNQILYMPNPAVDTLSIKTAQPPKGLYINAVGAITGKRVSGKIIIPSANVAKNNGGVMKDVIFASYKSERGDSGGIVYALNKNQNIRYTVGIHVAHIEDKSTGVFKYSVSAKADNINKLLELRRY